MRPRLIVAILLAGAAPARAGAFTALRVGVFQFETADAAASGASASDLFSAALYRNFPGLSVVARTEIEAELAKESRRSSGGGADQEPAALLQERIGLQYLVRGDVLALERDADGGGTLMMSARLVKLSSGEILWADTRTVRTAEPLLSRIWRKAPRNSDAAVTGELLELAVFALVQDLGKRLPEEALVPGGRRAAGERSEAQDCAPPAFYRSLPRDDDWYYAVGKDPDTDKARDAAQANLAKQLTGGAESRSLAEREAADKIADLPPRSGPLAGWEQDDFQRCGGVSYVLIRVEKARVREFVAEHSRARYAPPPPADKVPSDRVLEEISRANVARSAMIYSDIMSPRGSCGAQACADAPTPAEAGVLAEARRKLAAGTITAAEIIRVSGIYMKHSEAAEEGVFFDAVLYRKLPLPPRLKEDYEVTRELAFPLAWNAALARKDWQGFFKYSRDYLRSYPNGFYAAAAEKNRRNAAKVLVLQDREEPGWEVALKDD